MFPAAAQLIAKQSAGGCPGAYKEALAEGEAKHEAVWYRTDYAAATVSNKGSEASSETEVTLSPPSTKSPLPLKMIHDGGPWQVAEAGRGPAAPPSGSAAERGEAESG